MSSLYIEKLMIIDVMLCWPNFVSWLFNFHHECLINLHWISSLSYKLLSHWIYSGPRILIFAKLNILSFCCAKPFSLLSLDIWFTTLEMYNNTCSDVHLHFFLMLQKDWGIKGDFTSPPLINNIVLGVHDLQNYSSNSNIIL